MTGLTGLRFFLAAWVVLFHAERIVNVGAAHTPVVAQGYLAVQAFFVLSGFVLTRVYGSARGAVDAAGAPPMVPVVHAQRFWRARVARVLPMYAVSLVVAVPLGIALRARGVVTDAHPALSLLAVACGVQAWVPGAQLAWNPPLWSVSVELFFYALFPVLMPWLVTMPPRRAWAVCICALLAAVACSMAYVVVAPDALAHVDTGSRAPWLDALKTLPVLRLPEFMLGVVLARADAEPFIKRRVLIVGVAVCTLVGLAFSGWSDAVLHNAVCAPLFAAVVLACAGTVPILSSRPLQVLGDASYALYVLHVPVIGWCAAWAARHERDTAPAVAVGVVLSVGLSVWLMRAIERPLRLRLRGPSFRDDATKETAPKLP